MTYEGICHCIKVNVEMHINLSCTVPSAVIADSSGTIVGGLVAAMVILTALVIVAVTACWFWFRRAEKRKRAVTDAMMTLDQLRFVMCIVLVFR